jgi:histidine triad (HIT) family protein
MENCLFCKIVRKEIPAEVVYENGKTIAFLDIKPVNPGHVLVVPKEHHPDFASTPADQLGDIAAVAQKVAKAAMAALGAPGFNIGVNNGRAAGQLVDHMHLHVMPRFEGDGRELWHGEAYPEGEMGRVAERLRAAL